jgi:hypothetical protein
MLSFDRYLHSLANRAESALGALVSFVLCLTKGP